MGKEEISKIIGLVSGKNVSLVAHWDCDGVTSGAIIYHLIKDFAKSITIKTKGEVFSVEENDIEKNADIAVCVDIPASRDLLEKKDVILIDHHPNEYTDLAKYAVYDKDKQSCSLLIFEKILYEKYKVESYYVFLSLLGFFGDNGSNKNIPIELQIIAGELIPDMMKKNKSYYSNDYYLEIEKYVSVMNIGKRVNWSGDLPLKMLSSMTDYHGLTDYTHPIARTLLDEKKELNKLYNQLQEITDLGHMHLIEISCEKNIQGVICARHMKDKPIIVINSNTRNVMASIRAPEHTDHDVGQYLNKITANIPGIIAGGHEKAGGASIVRENYGIFKRAIIENKF